MLKTYQFKTQCKGDIHSSKTANIILPGLITEYRWTVVQAFIMYLLDYCNSLLFGVADDQLQRLQAVQNATARLVSGARRSDHITPLALTN